MRVRKKKLRIDMLVLFIAVSAIFLFVVIQFAFSMSGDIETEQNGNAIDEQSSDSLASQPSEYDSESFDNNDANITMAHADNALDNNDVATVEQDIHGNPSEPATTLQIISINDTNPELTELLDEEALSHRAAGAQVVVFDAFDGVFYTFNYGYADIAAGRPINTDTKIRSASLSKLVVAVCAMVLVDEGRLDLDEDISEYLGFQVRNPNFPGTPITARMLLQHTSTIVDSEAFNNSIFGVERLTTETLLGRNSTFWDVRPGTNFHYSNFGFSVLGAVIEMISGEKLDAFARRTVFEPLGIDAAFFVPSLGDHGNIAILYDAGHDIIRSVDRQLEIARQGELGQDQAIAQGALMISAFDYAKILAMLGNGGQLFDVRILSAEAVREMHTPDVIGWGYYHGFSTRFDVGDLMPHYGFYWHTGSAHGVFAQNIYTITGDYGYGGVDRSRGVVVITTGASTGRYDNGMIAVCTHLSQIAWEGLGF